MRRRQTLAALGAALAAGLAGCTGGGGGNEGETATDTATATATDTATATATDTATATPTATPTPSTSTVSVGETFAMGEGADEIRITVRRLLQAQALGPTGNEEATDIYLLVVMTVENPTSSPLDVPANRMKLRAPGIIRNVDLDASEAVTEDRRLEFDSVATASVTPGESKTGSVVFDAPAGNDYRLEITPPGDGPAVTVPVGDPADAEPVESGY